MTDHDEREHEPLIADATQPPPARRPPVSSRTFWAVLVLSYLQIFCSQFYASSFNTVLYETLEGLLCRDIYGPDDVSDPLSDPRCKGEAVQAALSLLVSIEASLEMIPPLLCGIAYGMVADVYGRKPILILATFGAVLYGLADIAICWFHPYIPIKLFWAVPAIYFFSGGAMVAGSMNFTMVTDVLKKSQRSAVFLALNTAFISGAFLSAYLAAAVLPYGHFPAMSIILLIQVAGLVFACFVPETIHIQQRTSEEDSQDEDNGSSSLTKKLSTRITELRARSASSFKEMFWGGNTKLTLLLMSTLFSGVGKDVVGGIRKQYAVKRYSLSWAEAGLILSIGDLVRLFVALAAVPLLAYALRRAKVLPIKQDFWIARCSILFALLASCMAGAASDIRAFTVSVVVYAFSYCLEPTVRSLVVAMARDAGTASIISAMEVLTALGVVVSGPIVAATFRLGMRWGGGWVGLPMFIGAMLMVPGAGILMAMRYADEVAEETVEESEGLL